MIRHELARLWRRIGWAWQGWMVCWRTEKSLRQWTIVNAISILLAVVLDLSPAERGLILALGVLVLAAELMNSAIERAVDRISSDLHPLAKQAKDMSSTAVALTAVAGAAAWLVILIG